MPRKVTLVYCDEPAAVFELRLPASWTTKPCSKLVEHFVESYKRKHAIDLGSSQLELLLLPSGDAIDADAPIGETIAGSTELAVAKKQDLVPDGPIVVVLGEVETAAGVAGDELPRATVPSYVKGVHCQNLFSMETAAGGSSRDLLDQNKDVGEARYPVRSEGIVSSPLSSKSWADLELIVRNVLVESGLVVADRHLVCVVPSRSTPSYRKELLEMWLCQHGAASVAIVPLAVAALTYTRGDWRQDACVVDCGHDSSCAVLCKSGLDVAACVTPRGGHQVSLAFRGLLENATSDAGFSDANPHDLHLAKKALCSARPLGGAAPARGAGRITLASGADALVSEEAVLATEVLFDNGDETPPLHGIVLRAVNGDATLLANLVVTGTDDARLPGIDVRLAQELSRALARKASVFDPTTLTSAAQTHQSPGCSSLGQCRRLCSRPRRTRRGRGLARHARRI